MQTLSLQRHMMENLIIAKARQDAVSFIPVFTLNFIIVAWLVSKFVVKAGSKALFLCADVTWLILILIFLWQHLSIKKKISQSI